MLKAKRLGKKNFDDFFFKSDYDVLIWLANKLFDMKLKIYLIVSAIFVQMQIKFVYMKFIPIISEVLFTKQTYFKLFTEKMSLITNKQGFTNPKS